MRIVSVAPYVPAEGAPYAGQQWYFHWLGQLAQRGEVTVVAPADEANVAAADHLAAPVHLVPRHRWTSSTIEGELRGRGRYLALQRVLSADRGVDRLLRQADVIDVQWAEMLGEVHHARRLGVSAKVTAVEHDVHFAALRWGKLRSEPPLRRSVSAAAGRVFRRAEVSALRKTDAVFTFSDVDASLLRSAGLMRRPVVLGPWLQLPSGPPVPADPPEVLFVGALDRRPNIEAVTWLMERVWPSVAAAVPGARLVVAGAGASAELVGCAGPSVAFTGYLTDLDPVYRSAAVVVAPVFGGAGLRFKVPQAMLYGCPLVVTPTALEGMSAMPSDAVMAVTDDPAKFAEAVVHGLLDRRAAALVASVAQRWAQSAFSFERSVEAAMAVWAR